MSNKRAIVKMHYFFVEIADLVNNADGFDIDTNKKLEEVLSMLQQKSVSERSWRPNGVMDNSINLQKVEKLKSGFWKLEFIKIRDEAMPGKINTDGVFTDIPLEENEYIGEDMTVIYAPDKRLLGVQRNFYSVSADRIADYFSAMQTDVIFRFSPITGEAKVPENALIRSVEISCYDLDNVTLEDTIENSNTYGAKRISYYYSVGTNAKNASLMGDIREYWNRIMHRYKGSCKRVKVSYKESADSPISSIDLLEPKLEDRISIPYSKVDKLTHDKIFLAMLPKFNERYNAL